MMELSELCKKLRLPHVLSYLEAENLDETKEIIHTILFHEYKMRQSAKINRLLTKAKFREYKHYQDFE